MGPTQFDAQEARMWANGSMRIAIGALVMLALVVISGAGEESAGPSGLATRFRQPVVLALVDEGATLLAATRRAGSVSVVDMKAGRVVAECPVGRGLADLALLPDGRHLIAVDQEGDALLLLEWRGRSIQVSASLSVAADPVRVVVLPGGSACAVTSRWSRRLTLVDVEPGPEPGLGAARVLDLPFMPRELIAIGDGSALVVVDAFGGRVAVVDVRGGRIDPVRDLPAHNIRGLALAPDGRTLVVAHQTLSRLATTSFDDVHWGSLINNHLRLLLVDVLRTPGADLLKDSRLIDLGEVGRAAGDPSSVAFVGSGFVVAFSGVDEVALGSAPDVTLRRVGVGRLPTALASAADGKTVYVADGLDDTISVVDVEAGARVRTIALGPRPDLSPADRGERLFSDARLSHHGWMSCQSCHTDGHTIGQLADTLGDGSYGAPKLVPSLLGVGQTGPWAWNGGISRLEDQVRQSIETTMRGAPPSREQVEDLTAYLRGLSAPPVRAEGDGDAIARGRRVFRKRGCVTCHAPPAYTSAERSDVGLEDERGQRAYNPPSLRGVSRRDRFFHDGRAGSLDEVFRRFRHPNDTAMMPGEIDDLIRFLKML